MTTSKPTTPFPRFSNLLLAVAALSLSWTWAPTVAAQPAPVATDELQTAQSIPGSPSSRTPQALPKPAFVPAVLRLSFTAGQQSAATDNGFIDLVLIPPNGEVVGRRVELSTQRFATQLRSLYSQLSRQEDLKTADPSSPSRQIYALLIEPLIPEIKSLGITDLLISADQGLQAVPLAALHDGASFFGEAYAFSLTPSIGLMPLAQPLAQQKGQLVAAGASRFQGLTPLPLVPQELDKVAASEPASANAIRYLDHSFTPDALLASASDPRVDQVHVATHAEFLPGGSGRSQLYTGTNPVSLGQFASLRQRRQDNPLDLFVLSACRTALGDRDSELGFAGLALQAGSRSAVGSLWYVDDVATSAFFVQFYRNLNAGMPKAQAMQRVRQAMATGQFQLKGDVLVGPDNQAILTGLTVEQQRRVSTGLTNPFFWAGIQLLGAPW